MTREEAIECNKNLRMYMKISDKHQSYKFLEENYIALDMAIKALEQEPCDVFDEYGNYKYPSDVELTEPNTATSMPCDDAISRQAVKELYYKDGYIGFRKIYELPPVTPQPKTGHWIRELIRNEKGGCIGAKMICSECGNDNKHDEYMNYCPNCGAKMVEPQERSE